MFNHRVSSGQWYGPVCIKIIIVCVVAYVLQSALFHSMASTSNEFALIFWRNPDFALWQLVSYIFLHGSVTHLLFNMLALYMFGLPLENYLGKRRLVCFFIICGVMAALAHLAVNTIEFYSLKQTIADYGLSESEISQLLATGQYSYADSSYLDHELIQRFFSIYHQPMIGASGSVYGILVAFALLYPNAKIMLLFPPIPLSAKYLIPIVLLFDLLSGLTGFSIFGTNIAHFSHLGGAVTGFILIRLLQR